MFGGFPKLFDRNFVIGFLLPVILGLIVFAWLFPGIALLAPLRVISASESSLSGFTYLALASYGLGVLLMMTNTLQFRLIEGYLPPLSYWERGRKKHEAVRLTLSSDYAAFEERWGTEDVPVAEIERAADQKVRLINDYPPLGQPVLPTRFGNAIRAFESYPLEVYGADGTPIWLRLASVVPKDFAGKLEDARAQVNFLVNLLYLLGIVAVVAFAQAMAETPWSALIGALQATNLAGWYPQPALLLSGAALLLLGPVYSFAVERAKAWGDVVKAAFDCYLPALIEQLGYAQPPTNAARRTFWGQISALIVFRQPLDPGTYEIASSAESLRSPRDGLRSEEEAGHEDD